MANHVQIGPQNAFYAARLAAAQDNPRLASREGAEEITSINAKKIQRIETSEATPWPEEVLVLADAYKAPELCNYYCTHCCKIGCQNQQRVEVAELDRVTVKIMSAFRRDSDIKDMLLDITADGIIETSERSQLAQILASLDKISVAAAELKLWVAKNLD